MKNPARIGIAVLATASIAFAGGDDDKKKGGDKTAKPTTEKGLSSVFQGAWKGAAGDGLTFESQDFSLKLRSGVQVAINYANIDSAPDRTAVTLNRARTALSGFLHKKEITYKLSNEWTEATSVKEAWLDWGFHNTDAYSIAVRVGQLKTRFGKNWNSEYDQLDFVARGLATNTFSGVRTRAAMLHGAAQNSQLNWSVTLQNGDMAGAANNSGEEGDPRVGAFNDDTDNEVNWTIDVHWTQNPKAVRMGSADGNLDDEKGFGAGLAYFIGSGKAAPATTDTDTETTSGNLWGEWKSGNGIAVNAEYFMRDEEQTGAADAEATGYQAAISWTQRKIAEQPQWGAGLRYSFVELDAGGAPLHLTGGRLGGAAGLEASDIDLVVNMFYHEHKLKSQLGISYQNTKAPAGPGANTDNYVLSLQTTFVF